MIRKRNKGFTLIELLIVIAIIAILAGIIVATLGNPTGEARDSKRCQAVDSVGDAAQQYLIGEGAATYPATLDALITKGYLSSEPMDPADGTQHYNYAVCNVNGNPRVIIGATLEVDIGAGSKAANDLGTIDCDALPVCVDDADNDTDLCDAVTGDIDCDDALDTLYCIAR